MTKIGRNEPCPCGSGKKYKHCCGRTSTNIIPFPQLGNQGPTVAASRDDDEPTFMERLGTPNRATDLIHELKAEFGDRVFTSQAELEAAFSASIEHRQKTPLADFLGLSPDQMHRILDGSFQDIDGFFEFHGHLTETDVPSIPLLDETLALLGYLVESGPVKATAKGNLPRAFVLRWWDGQYGPREPDERLRAISRPNNEEGCWPLHVVRLISRKACLVKLHDNKFSVTDRGRALLSGRDLDGIYRALFVALVWGIDWNEGKEYYRQSHPFAQRSFIFNLHLFGTLARDWTTGERIVEAYLKAFPMIRNDYKDGNSPVALTFIQILLGNDLTHFPVELGLLEYRGGIWSESQPDEYRVTPLFDRLLGWKL